MKILILAVFTALLQVTNICSQWVSQPITPPAGVLFSVDAFDENNVWASGELGTVLYTSNGGTNWAYKPSNLFGNANVFSIQAISPTTAVAVYNVAGGRVIRTTNQGLFWTNTFVRASSVLNDIKFLDANTGYVFGNPFNNRFFIIRTTNGGISFDTTTINRPVATNPNVQLITNSACLFRAAVGGPISIWFGTSVGLVYHSTNSGLSWDSTMTQSGVSVNAVTFINHNTGFCAGDDPFSTVNGGNSWLFQASYPNTGRFYSFQSAGGYYWYTSGPGIYVSTNNGLTFEEDFTNPSNQDFRHLVIVSSGGDNSRTVFNGWGVTSNGLIYHNSETIGITPIGNIVPQNYSLQQNYPNPFNPVTKIQFDLPEKGFIRLSVFDILGNQVDKIFEGSLNAGKYEADFDGSKLSSGVYFYTMESGNFKETKRMVLVK